ncbi:MAG: M20/M25/M40 family metallo-hydrolase [Acidobacteria bacterium]|nr:M20/M25/M40 family metallo-hydrolase [Acidobacteriota bacterium]MCW5967249.1 M20/M25/M40 family metallo-hydrolase [Blastocatellales bacterium]
MKGISVRLFMGLIVFCLLAATAAPGLLAQRSRRQPSADAVAPGPHGNVEAITEAQLKDYLYYVASDEMEGRDTPSRGLDLTANFIAMNLSRWGVKPVGDGRGHLDRYFQHMLLRRSKVDPAKTRADLGGQALKFGDDFVSSNVAGSASGEMVFAGNGWIIPGKNINPYQGIDVKDKIVVLQPGLPRGVNPRDIMNGKEGVDWESPYGMQQKGYLEKSGAKGIVVLPNTGALNNWKQNLQRSIERGSPWAVVKFQKDSPGLPSITLSDQGAAKLFEGESRDGAAMLKVAASNETIPSFALGAGKKIRFDLAVKSEDATTKNVVGVLEGSDPKLKDEYVAIGAHYDHVGTNPQISGDNIFNGADDDGSGTVAVLAIAEAFAKSARPKRSILFVWHAGEEKGLWGARYITEFPVVPLDRIVAQLNIDMIGRSKQPGDTAPANRDLSGPDEVYVIGSKMMSTELGALSEEVNKSFLKLLFNYKYDDPKDPNRFFFRSDHYHYAKNGIPIIFYFSGVHEDYHKVSDHPDKIDYRKLAKVTRTIAATAWAIANRATRPVVDKQLPAELSNN